ncbi:MAG: hypothetical protein AAGF49_08590 [Pseudomonadota bacterium]
MRRVVVHIGLEKAASTSLQAQLVAARDELAAGGTVFPQLGGGGAKDQRDLRFAFGIDPPARMRVVQTLSSAGRDADTLVLSGETLYNVAPAHLTALLAEAGWGDAAVSAVAIVREPAGWLDSRYAFDALQFLHRRSFRAYLARALRGRRTSFMRAFTPWIDAADVHFTAVPLSPADGASVIVRTLQAMGLPERYANPSKSLNEAVDPRTVEAARRLSRYGIAAHGFSVIRPTRKVMLAAAAREGFSGRFQGLDAALVARIEAATAADLDTFAKAVWGGPWHDHYAARPQTTLAPNEWLRHNNEWLRHKGSDADRAAIARVVDEVRRVRNLRGGLLTRWTGR